MGNRIGIDTAVAIGIVIANQYRRPLLIGRCAADESTIVDNALYLSPFAGRIKRIENRSMFLSTVNGFKSTTVYFQITDSGAYSSLCPCIGTSVDNHIGLLRHIPYSITPYCTVAATAGCPCISTVMKRSGSFIINGTGRFFKGTVLYYQNRRCSCIADAGTVCISRPLENSVFNCQSALIIDCSITALFGCG